MARKYQGFAIRIEEKEKGTFFKRTEREERFCRINVGGVDSFAEAQEVLCDKMEQYKMPVAIIFPYYTKEEES